MVEFIIALLASVAFKDLSSCEGDWSSRAIRGLSENLHATDFLIDAGQVPFPSFKLSACSLVLSNQKDKLEIAS